MTNNDRTTESSSTLEAKRQVAILAVQRLLATCWEHERKTFLNRYVDVLNALHQGCLQDAIDVEREWPKCTRTCDESLEPVWVISRELAKEVHQAVVRIRTHIDWGDGREPLNLPTEPIDVRSKGTINEELQRSWQAFKSRIRRDPIENDPQYAEVIKEVNSLTDLALQNHPIIAGIGLLKVFWETKKAILKDKYDIDWKPPEFDPKVLSDLPTGCFSLNELCRL
jgi:hypothetical protein